MSATSTAQKSPEANSHKAHSAFEWIRSQRIDTLNIEMQEYRHKKTGASHFHLASEDTENVFLVALRTVPMDSKGVAHILEHTALCGSKKYPVRDPFFMMIRRSLNTFMNAFTSSDWTAYPFASKNRKDFQNLLEVYLDAVFFSRLHELDFSQEGHRLEFAEADNPKSDLQFKGVVFNEMKGAMSSTNSILWQTLSKYLFPTTTYHYNSGGDPDHIPDLSYEELKAFYKTHYHPSNAVFMTYGDIPAAQHQASFEDLALSQFDKLAIDIHVDDEKRYFAPLRVQESYPLENQEEAQDKTHIVLGWLLGKSIDLNELFEAQLLSSVLLDTSASPLMNALETSELGASPSPMCGLEDSNREMSFVCGLEGCATTSTAAVEALVKETLEKVVETGIPTDQVEAALHQLELHQREITGDSYPYGLQLIMAGISSAVHGGDPIQLLDIEPALASLREKIKNPDFIPGLIRRHLLDNQHNVVLTLSPDAHFAQRQVNAEMQRLEKIKAALTPEQSQAIVERSQALAQRQEHEDDPGVLPKVGIEDVPKEIPLLTPTRSIITLGEHEADLSFYAQGTNGLCYQQVVVEIPQLEDELLAILPYYTSCLAEFGVGERSYTDVQTWQSRISGGINCYANVRANGDDEQQSRAILVLSSKALVANQEAMTELLEQTFSHVRFDEVSRLRELIDQMLARRESGITSQGHALAMSLASSGYSPSAKLAYQYTGLEGIRTLRAISKAIKDDSEAKALLAKFAQLHQRVQSAPRQFLLVGEEAKQQELSASLERIWQSSPSAFTKEFGALTLPSSRQQVREMWTTNTQVNFCAKAFPTVPVSHPDHAALSVLAGYMRNSFLHRRIREQGGAYGGGADQNANSASFRFFSYRDPRLVDTLADFDAAIEWVLGAKHHAHHLEEAILGVISAMDKSSSPAGEAKQDFYNKLFGRTREQRMAFRQQVINTTLADLQRVTSTYLDPSKASIGIISNSAQSEAAKELKLKIQSL
ncbi:MAG: insulinase family protein [Pseudohongiellaceae bacterium]|nr:insulinase family protein [Pseudohongiellaceae bacterium]